jgi:site-specific recombinase XerD
MSQYLDVAFEPLAYTKTDFTALRFWVVRMDPPMTAAQIANRFYDRESTAFQESIGQYLDSMRDDLINRCIYANPSLAQFLTKTKNGGRMSNRGFSDLIDISRAKVRDALPEDLIGRWFRPAITRIFIGEGVSTLLELRDLIEFGGHRWNRSIPRLGNKRAEIIFNWFQRQPRFEKIDFLPMLKNDKANTVVLEPNSKVFAPLSRTSIAEHLNGSLGLNRSVNFSYISAKNDLEAIQDYLHKKRNSAKTKISYEKELYRFLLFCIVVRKKALSSVLIDDCEAYKDFIDNIPPQFIGPKLSRTSARWRPFNTPLSRKSQKYSIQVIRTFFEWLVAVRYLAGNPWQAIEDPRTETAENEMMIHTALSGDLWSKLKGVMDTLCANEEQAQMRVAYVAMLLMGESGLRRSEVASAMRSKLQSYQNLYELQVLGKRSKWRTVPISKHTYQMIEAHFRDRGQNIDKDLATPLLSPIEFMNVQKLDKDVPVEKEKLDTFPPGVLKHTQDDMPLNYTGDGIYKMVKQSLKRIATEKNGFTIDEIAQIKSMTVHSFRHTCGSVLTAQGFPTEVLQKMLGHTSISTTSIYQQLQKKRLMEEAQKIFSKSTEEEKNG